MNYYQTTQKSHNLKYFDEINQEFNKENYEETIQILGVFKGFLLRQESIDLYNKRKNKKDQFSFQLKKNIFDNEVETSSILLIQQENYYILVDSSNLEDKSFLKKDCHLSLFGKFEINEDDIPIFFANIIHKEEEQIDWNFMRQATKILRIENIMKQINQYEILKTLLIELKNLIFVIKNIQIKKIKNQIYEVS